MIKPQKQPYHGWHPWQGAYHPCHGHVVPLHGPFIITVTNTQAYEYNIAKSSQTHQEQYLFMLFCNYNLFIKAQLSQVGSWYPFSNKHQKKKNQVSTNYQHALPRSTQARSRQKVPSFSTYP